MNPNDFNFSSLRPIKLHRPQMCWSAFRMQGVQFTPDTSHLPERDQRTRPHSSVKRIKLEDLRGSARKKNTNQNQAVPVIDLLFLSAKPTHSHSASLHHIFNIFLPGGFLFSFCRRRRLVWKGDRRREEGTLFLLTVPISFSPATENS